MAKCRYGIAVAVLSIVAVHGAIANGVLLGTGTLNNVDDLTRIQVGGNVLEFLDLSATSGSTVASAVSTYGGYGFHWATGSEVTNLYSAFGITYANSLGALSDLGATPAQRTRFVGYLGDSGYTGGQSLGWIDDLTSDQFHTYSCISIFSCGPESFVYSAPATFRAWPADPVIGVYLDRVSTVPEPSTYGLMVAGLVWLASSGRRRLGKC
jgi:hypothetical protein